MGSSRNLLITGLALFLSISVPEYFNTFTLANGHGPVNTNNAEVSCQSRLNMYRYCRVAAGEI